MKASWKGKQIAQSEHTVVVEGNHYFPPESVDMSLLVPSDTQTRCSWKGVASYYTIQADEQSNVDACWYYPEPKEAASQIKGHLAFWRGVEVSS